MSGYEIVDAIREAEKNILIAESSGEDPTVMFERIRQINQEMSSLLELVVNSDTPEIYDRKFKSLSDEKTTLQQKVDSMTKQADSRSQKRLEKLLGEITESEVRLADYNYKLRCDRTICTENQGQRHALGRPPTKNTCILHVMRFLGLCPHTPGVFRFCFTKGVVHINILMQAFKSVTVALFRRDGGP